MKNIFFTLVGLVFSCGTHASEIDNTKITRLMMDSTYGTKLFIQVEGTPTRESSHCHANVVWDYALDTSTEFGKQILSQVLAAYAAQKSIKIFGSDNCTVHSSAEDFKRIELL